MGDCENKEKGPFERGMRLEMGHEVSFHLIESLEQEKRKGKKMGERWEEIKIL